MKNISINSFNVIGIKVRTNNSDYIKLAHDMQNLWNKFISENVAGQIQNKIDTAIYCIYTDYEGDYTKPYTAFLGCKVSDLSIIPEGLEGKSFKDGLYNKYTAKGNILDGIVYEKWKYIWGLDICRTYNADFEVYGEKSQNPENAEVEIFIGVKI